MFGGLLLLQQVYPNAQSIWALLELAIGLAFLSGGRSSVAAAPCTWAPSSRRWPSRTSPRTRASAGTDWDVLIGIAFLFIALVRVVGGGGIGWQAWIGGLFTIIGIVNLATPQIGGLIVPLALVLIGGMLVLGAIFRPSRAGRSKGPPTFRRPSEERTLVVAARVSTVAWRLSTRRHGPRPMWRSGG